jgi:hypothetical protein
MADVMICAQSAQVLVDDGHHLESVVVDRTTAHADHPVVVGYPHLWRPLTVDYPTSGPEPAVAEEEPAAKDVREWAADNDVDVNAKGPLPADVVERYRQAHTGGEG